MADENKHDTGKQGQVDSQQQSPQRQEQEQQAQNNEQAMPDEDSLEARELRGEEGNSKDRANEE